MLFIEDIFMLVRLGTLEWFVFKSFRLKFCGALYWRVSRLCGGRSPLDSYRKQSKQSLNSLALLIIIS
jgi:hypothetical protein